jgi:hypothetical protein
LDGWVEVVEVLATVGVGGGGDVAVQYCDGGSGGDRGSWDACQVDCRELAAELRGTVALLVLQGVVMQDLSSSAAMLFSVAYLMSVIFSLSSGSKWRVVFLP